jgi:hypothetical protein
MILSVFSPPKFGQLPTKNEGGVGRDSYLFQKKCPKSRPISRKKGLNRQIRCAKS